MFNVGDKVRLTDGSVWNPAPDVSIILDKGKIIEIFTILRYPNHPFTQIYGKVDIIEFIHPRSPIPLKIPSSEVELVEEGLRHCSCAINTLMVQGCICGGE